MKRVAAGVAIVLAATGLVRCGEQKLELTAQDRALAAKTGVSETFLLHIKRSGHNLRQLEGTDAGGEPTKAKGVTIDVTESKALSVARRLRELAPPGHVAFVSEMNFGIGGNLDHVSVLRASSPYAVIETMGTNARDDHRTHEALG
jgi:hypothetical protein